MSIPVQRAVVFIDNHYLECVLRDEFQSVRIDYLLLPNEITAGYLRLRTYVYDALPYQGSPPTREESERVGKKQEFFNKIESYPSTEVRQGKQKLREWGFIQKAVDVLLAMDMITISVKRQIQKAVLISGDADFVPVVKACKNEGVSVTLYCSARTPVDELGKACDERYYITRELIDKVRYAGR